MLADAAWTQPLDVARANAGITRLVAAPGGHLGWIEGRRTFARVRIPGKVRRTELDRAWRTAGMDARGRAITITTVTSRRPCRGKRSYRVYVEVRRDGAKPQRLGDGCRNLGDPRLAVNARGQAVLAWLEIPSGAEKRLVVATGSTRSGLRPHWSSGEGDAAGHAVAINEHGGAVVAFRRGSRMLARVRRTRGFLRAQDLGATPQRAAPATAVAIDETGAATVAWTDLCACGEAGMTPAPNPLRAIRSDEAGRFPDTAQVLDTGEHVAGPPLVAAGQGVSAVAWGTENGPEGTLVAVSPPHDGFRAPHHLPEGGVPAVDAGVPTLVGATQAWRWQDGSWAAEAVGASGMVRALFAEADGRLALVTQDGERLRVSYRSG